MLHDTSTDTRAATPLTARPSGDWGLAVLLVAALLACSLTLCYLAQPTAATLGGAYSYPADNGAADEPSQSASYTAAFFAIFFGVLLGVLFGGDRTTHTTVLRPLLAGARTSGPHLSQRPRRALLQVFLL